MLRHSTVHCLSCWFLQTSSLTSHKDTPAWPHTKAHQHTARTRSECNLINLQQVWSIQIIISGIFTVQQLVPSKLTSVYLLQMDNTWPWEDTVCTVQIGLMSVHTIGLTKCTCSYLSDRFLKSLCHYTSVSLCIIWNVELRGPSQHHLLNHTISICRNMLHIDTPVDAPGHILHAAKAAH